MRKVWLVALLALVVAGLPVLGGPAGGVARAQETNQVLALTLSGPLTPAMASYLQRGLRQAERMDAELVILRLNTPGGQIDLMDSLIALMRGGDTPVVVYVSPRGAMAGSAGTVITLAGHASAMAPETTIGAASPVGGQGEDIETTLEEKVKETLKAKVRGLAAGRPPEAIALAEATIDSARAATAGEAHEIGLVDFLAAGDADLLRQLDGFVVNVNDQPRTLSTADATVSELSMNLIESLLNLLTNPNIVFLLLAVGAQAILIELSSPGGWVPGFIGVVALALAFYGLGVLPVNWFGLIFMGMAFVLFIMEVHAPTHGGLAAAGIGSLIVGALVLFNSPGSPEFFRVSVPLVVGTSLAAAGGVVVLMTFALRAQRRPPAVGAASLVGQVGEARGPNMVQVAGELWSAELAEGESAVLEPNQKVVVAGVRGLRLLVRPVKKVSGPVST